MGMLASIMIDFMWMQVHERTLQGDFLIALLRDIVHSRRARGHPLKVNNSLAVVRHFRMFI